MANDGDLTLRMTIRADAAPVEAALRGMVKFAREAAVEMSRAVRAGIAGADVPAPDLSAFEREVAGVRSELARLDAERVDIEVSLTGADGAPVEDEIDDVFANVREQSQDFFYMREAATASFRAIGDRVSEVSAPLLSFESAMANVNSLLSDGQDAAQLYSAEVLDLVDVTKTGAVELTEGLYQIVSAYGAGRDSTEQLEISARAAKAGLSTVTESIDLLSAVTKGYGDTSADMQRQVADLALNTVKLGQTTFPQLAGSIGRVVPLSASLGVSMEELFGVMATGTGVTGTAAEVSTQFRGILESLSNPTAEMTSLFGRLGVANGEVLIQQRGVAGAIAAVTQAAEASGQPLAKYIGSIEGQTLALALAGGQAESFKANLGEMADASGAMEEAFSRNTDTLQTSLDDVRRETERMRIEALESAGSFAQIAVGGYADFLGVLNELPPGLRALGIGFSEATRMGAELAASGLAPLLAYGPQAITTIKGIVTATRAWVVANRALLASLGVVGIAVAAIGYAVSAATEASEEARRAHEEQERALYGVGAAADEAADAWRGLTLAELAESERALTAGIEMTSQALADQKKEVDELRAAWERASAARQQYDFAGDPGSRAASSAATFLNLQPTDLNKAEETAGVLERRLAAAQAQLQQVRAQMASVQAQAAATTASAQAAQVREAQATARRAAEEARRRTDRIRTDRARIDSELEREEAARRSSLARQLVEIRDWREEAKRLAHGDAETLARIEVEYLGRVHRAREEYAERHASVRRQIEADVRRFNGEAESSVLATEAVRLQALWEAAEENSERREQLALDLQRVELEIHRATRAEREKATDDATKAEAARREADAAELATTITRIEVEGAERAALLGGVERVVAETETAERVIAIRLDVLRRALADEGTYAGLSADERREREAELTAQILRLEGDKRAAQKRSADAWVEEFDRAAREVEAHARRAFDVVADELFRQREISDEEVDQTIARLAREEAEIKESLRRRQGSREAHEERLREIALERSEFEKEVERDRRGFMERSIRAVGALALETIREEGVAWAAKEFGRLAVRTVTEEGMTAVTLAGALKRGAALAIEAGQSLAAAAASMVGAVASAIWSGAKLPFPANIPAIGAGVGAVTAAYLGAKSLFGFKAGGYTGDGDPDQIAGPVHAGEYVFDAPVVQGRAAEFDQLREVMRRGVTPRQLLAAVGVDGYRDGGYVMEPLARSVSVIATPPRIQFSRPESAGNRDLGPLLDELRQTRRQLERSVRAAETAAEAALDAKRITGRDARSIQRAAQREIRSRGAS